MTAKEFLSTKSEYLKIKNTQIQTFSNSYIEKLQYLKQRDKIIHQDILEKIDKLQRELIER
jgi:mevalonate kinase